MADLTIGGPLDPTSRERTDGATVIGSADLTTHGVIIGMTGSGKTGLGIVLIEECLAAGVPTLLIDPKGDLTNLCLTFPALAPADFAPWVNASDASKAGVSVEEFATQQAVTWKDGLAGWGIAPDRIAALREQVEFEVYTPGSAAQPRRIPRCAQGRCRPRGHGRRDRELRHHLARDDGHRR
jgi:hypothetical protein